MGITPHGTKAPIPHSPLLVFGAWMGTLSKSSVPLQVFLGGGGGEEGVPGATESSKNHRESRVHKGHRANSLR